MRIVTFNYRADRGYTCNMPEDRSGDYVPVADVARLVEALRKLVGSVSVELCDMRKSIRNSVDVLQDADQALAAHEAKIR